MRKLLAIALLVLTNCITAAATSQYVWSRDARVLEYTNQRWEQEYADMAARYARIMEQDIAGEK